jgi:hypothetical protein
MLLVQIATNGSNLGLSTQNPQISARFPHVTKQQLTTSGHTSARRQQLHNQAPADREYSAPQTCSLPPRQQRRPTPWPCLPHHSSTPYCRTWQPVLLLQQQLHQHCKACLQPTLVSPGLLGPKATTTSAVLARNSLMHQSSSSSAGEQGPSTSGGLECLC